MLVKTLQIKNFCNIDNLQIAPAPGLAIIGRNHTGKSSILNAVRQCLLGITSNTMERQWRDNVKTDCQTAQITMELEHNGTVFTIMNTLADKQMWTCRIGDQDAVSTRPAFWKLIGSDYQSATCALMADTVLQSTTFDDALLAVFGSPEIEQTELQIACGDWWKQFDIYMRECGFSCRTARDVKLIADDAYGRRTESKRQLKAMRAVLESKEPPATVHNAKGIALTGADIPQIESWLMKHESKYIALQAELKRAEAAGDLSEYHAAHVAAESAHDRAVEWQRTTHATMTDLQQSAAIDANTKTARESELRKLQAGIKTIAALRDKCPTCGGKITPAQIETALAPLRAQESELVTEIASFAETTRAMAAKIQAAIRDDQCAQTEVNVTRTALRNAEARLNSVTGHDGTPIEDIRAAIDAHILKGQEAQLKLEQLRAWADYQSEIDAIKKQETYIEFLEWVCDSFHKGAISNGLLSGGIGEFTARANTYLARFGQQIQIDIADRKTNINLQSGPNADFIPIRRASKGQLVLVAYAVAFGFANGELPVMVDDANNLDAFYREQLFTIMKNCEQSSVFAAVALQVKRPARDKVEWGMQPIMVCWTGEVDTYVGASE